MPRPPEGGRIRGHNRPFDHKLRRSGTGLDSGPRGAGVFNQVRPWALFLPGQRPDMDGRAERRASLRILEVRDVFGALLPLGEPLIIRDLSAGGFAIDTPFEFLTSTDHNFAFCLPGGHVIRLNAMTIHCERISEAGSEALYRAGFSFLPAHAIDDVLIAVLADAARTCLLRPGPRRRRASAAVS